MFDSFFEQDHLLNLFILRFYAKRWHKYARILKQKLRTIQWGKKYGGYEVSFWKSRSFVYAELNETVEATSSSYSATGEFLRYIYSVLVAKDHENIQSRCLVHGFSFTDIFSNSILYGCGFLLILQCALQVYRTSLSIFILFQLQSWIILKVRTKFLLRNFHAKRVILEIATMKILNNCISGRLNNNYFPLNESSSHY